MFRRRKQHRRISSADDAVQEHAEAALEQQKQPQQAQLLRLRRNDVHMGKLLGEGGFAQVFSVTHKKQKLALKRLRPEKKGDKSAAKALVQESHILSLLQGHNHIVTLRGVACGLAKSFFLLTDALPEMLTDRVRHWSTSPSNPERWMDQLQYALQIAQALSYCHEHRIVYRDCKVDNVGFSDKKTIQLFDFGMARQLPEECDDFDDAQTCTSSLDEQYGQEEVFHMTMCGTQRHMAPEVYNRGWYNCKADVYSWAMTVVELITGKKPYPYMSLPVHKILVLEGGGRPNIHGFPTGLQHILRQSWAHSLGERWSMAQVCAALETYIGSECSQQAAVTVPVKDQVQVNRPLDVDVVQQHEVVAGAA